MAEKAPPEILDKVLNTVLYNDLIKITDFILYYFILFKFKQCLIHIYCRFVNLGYIFFFNQLYM